MILDRFNSTFPKATKVGYSRWKEIPVISLRFFFYKVNVWFSIKLCNLESSLFASTKFVALSENNFEQKPLRATNFFKHAMKASDVKSVTISRCTAFVTKHTKLHTYTPPKKYSSTWDISCPKTYIKCNFMKWILASHDL